MDRNGGYIAIYSRKSKFTGKGESIGNQIELCKDYVRNVFGEEYRDRCVIFEDEGFSGGNLKRPDFQRMMECARRRQFGAIVVYRLDRISRNISDFTHLIDELTRLDISFVSIREQFDTSTPMGRAMMFIISVFSQLERETIAERIRDNMHELAKTGRWLGGNTPTGYASESISSVTVEGKTRKACRLKLVPEEAEIVRVIFDLYTETDSLTAVEAELLRRRLKSKRGNDFTRFSIRGILQNPVYMIADEEAYHYLEEKGAELFSPREAFDGKHGLMVYNRTEQEKGRTVAFLPVTAWIIAVGKHPGIIPARQWIQIQAALERNKCRSYRKPRNNEAILTGLLFCSCGGRMYPKLSGRKTAQGEAVYTYVCRMKERSKRERCSRSNANGNSLDAAVMGQIAQLAEDDRSFGNQLSKSRQLLAGRGKKPESQLTDLRAELGENERKIEGLIDAMSELGDSSAKLRIANRIEQLSESSLGIESRIRELEGLISANTLGDMEFERLRQMLVMFQRNVDEMRLEEKRAAVRGLVHRVIWDGAHAHVVLFGTAEDETGIPGTTARTGSLEGAAGESAGDGKTHWGEDSK